MSKDKTRQDKTRQEELLPLVQRSYDLLGDLYTHVNRFPKAYKSLLGREILAASQRMLINLIAATRRRNRLLMLEEADLQLDTLRILIRLSHRLTFLSHKAYEAISKELTEIGRMLGGWIKAQSIPPHPSNFPRLFPPPLWGEEFKERERGGTKAAQISPPLMGGEKGEGDKADKKPLGRRPAVRYTMQSPKVEEYLKAKLEHPKEIILVKTGAFYKTFFEDALYLNKALNLKVTNLSARSETERIPGCGFPIKKLEGYRARFASLGRVFYVPE